MANLEAEARPRWDDTTVDGAARKERLRLMESPSYMAAAVPGEAERIVFPTSCRTAAGKPFVDACFVAYCSPPAPPASGRASAPETAASYARCDQCFTEWAAYQDAGCPYAMGGAKRASCVTGGRRGNDEDSSRCELDSRVSETVTESIASLARTRHRAI